jgi:3D (Asp-Asp-Asp) domain-containing protein
VRNDRITRRNRAVEVANGGPALRRTEFIRAVVAVTMAIALLGTGAIALPSLAPSERSMDLPQISGPQLAPLELAAIEDVHENAADLGSPLMESAPVLVVPAPTPVAKPVKETTRSTKSVAKASVATKSSARAIKSTSPTSNAKALKSGLGSSKMTRATAHEAIKMKRGIIPLIPSKFARAEDGVAIPVSLTQYCVQGETRRGRQTRHGIVAADPRIFPLARYVEVFLGKEYLGRYLVDDTGGNVLGATLDIWNPDCREAARFGRHWGTAILVARPVEKVFNDTLVPTRWDGLAKR